VQVRKSQQGTTVPLFGKTKKNHVNTPPPVLEDVPAQDFALKLSYAAKSSESVRIKAGPAAVARLARMLDGYVQGEPELVEPYPVELGHAAPFIARMPGAAEWLTYHRKRLPVTRHALEVLEAVDAVDLAFDTLVGGLLDGELDTSGYPEYNAIIGGVASHWDEMTGDMIVRAVVGWGGRGVRGDTDRNASRLLAGLFGNIQADRHSLGVVSVERPVTGTKTDGVVCAHCGFNSGHLRAFYCPKCGMRMARS
jgi:hypothetical protein